MAFCGAISRLPAPVRSAPGFLVNRALTPYLVEAFMLLDEGVTKETIDRAAEEFGMPMGPIELADRVGLDICLSVATMLKDRLDEPMPDIPEMAGGEGREGRTRQEDRAGALRL
jgi:3-hydroxyacyl-CoA dehydrogenase / enoyl-CoA hydratase / 3-hydroxybutyryl-CoA epimerase